MGRRKMSYLSPSRPAVETLGTSASTAASGQFEVSPSGHVQISDDDTVSLACFGTGHPADRVQQVEALQTKLAIERRVQYGAEKMLDVS